MTTGEIVLNNIVSTDEQTVLLDPRANVLDLIKEMRGRPNVVGYFPETEAIAFIIHNERVTEPGRHYDTVRSWIVVFFKEPWNSFILINLSKITLIGHLFSCLYNQVPPWIALRTLMQVADVQISYEVSIETAAEFVKYDWTKAEDF